MNRKPQASKPRIAATCRPQCGFSLIELMVAITIGLLIMAALIALYLNITRTNNEMAKSNSQIENGRFAMQILQSDIVHAGFWGEYGPQFDDLTTTTVPADAPTDVPAPCLSYDATNWNGAYKTNLLGISVQAYDAAPSGCTVVSNKKANTDVLVLRHAETCVPGVGNCEADTAGKLYFQASLCELENASPYKLDTTGLALHRRDCVGTGSPPALPVTAGTIADKRKFISHIYYIRDYAVTAGDGIPTLMRSQFDLSGGTLAHQAAVPLIEGIEGFSVEFGIDSLSDSGAAVNYGQAIVWADATNKISPTNRGDGIPDGAFIHCTTAIPCTFDKLTNVVALKLYVLARSRETTAGYTDTKTYALGSTTLGPFTGDQAKYKRHVFSTTVRLVNIAGRRETP